MNLLTLKKKLEKHFSYVFSLNKDLENGILSTNQAFIEAKLETKEKKTSPSQIALLLQLQIQEYLDQEYPMVFTVDTKGAYINIIINKNSYPLFFDNLQTFKIEDGVEARVILLDYISLNVAKQIHLGSMRNMNIGDSIRRLLTLKYKVVTNNHWGDWGVQFGKLLWGYKTILKNNINSSVIVNEEVLPVNIDFYKTDPLQALFRIYVWCEQVAKVDTDTYPNYEQEVRNEFLKLENKDQENYNLWLEFVEVSKREVGKDMSLFNVPKHMIEQGESYYEPYLKDLCNWFEENNLWQKEDKARFIDFEHLSFLLNDSSIKKLGRGYLISSTGYSTYLFRDIMARINWVDLHSSNLSITVTGNEQLHHFQQLFAICDYISQLTIASKVCNNYQNLKKTNLKHINYGFLTLKGGKKMSTRKGIVHTARDLYNTVRGEAVENLTLRQSKNIEEKADILTLAGIKWQDLSKDTVHDIEFDIKSILTFEGNTGIYQLYTVARINSILLKFDINKITQFDISKLNPKEQIILNKVLVSNIVIDEAIEKLKPHIIVNYCFELANLLNSWYNTTSVLKEEDILRQETLLRLLILIKSTLIFSLDQLGIKTLEEM